MQSFIIKLENQDENLINNDNICCYLLDSSFKKENLTAQLTQIRTLDKLAFIQGENAAELCAELDFDGVLLDFSEKMNAKAVAALRKNLGAGKYLGIYCPLERHSAMLASELEPEFLAFHIDDEAKAQEFLAWYGELFLIQYAVCKGASTCDLGQFDADFLILNQTEYKNFGC